jgi:integrase
MRQFYLHTRHKGIFYAELINPETREKLPAKSTGTRNRDEALLIVAAWLDKGVPNGRDRRHRPVELTFDLETILKSIRKSGLNGDDAMRIVQALKDMELIDVSVVKHGNGSVLFTEFLDSFWTYDNSPYVRDLKAHNHRIGRKHCKGCLGSVNGYWKPAFEGKRLNEITRQDLKAFSLALSKTAVPRGPEKMLSAGSINKIMSGGITALRWAYLEGMIPKDPTEGYEGFGGKTKDRGVLTPSEAEKVFATEWESDHAYIANLLACTTGIRLGEVLALRKSDVDETVLHVNHSWDEEEGLKCPKNGDDRKVPLFPEVRNYLLALVATNPHTVNDPFIFYGDEPDKPYVSRIYLDALKSACAAIGINAEARDIVFHSHRHYYAARMTDKMTAEQVSRITGHKSMPVFKKYADHVSEENLQEAGNVGAGVFENILKAKSNTRQTEQTSA